MWKTFLVLAATAALAVPAGAAASTLTVRVTATPHFSGPNPTCPAFRGAVPVESADGSTIGSVQMCFATFELGQAGVVATGTLTFALHGGRIVASVTITETPTSADSVLQSVSGTVVAGSGLYGGATGTISGGGPIIFDARGPHPELTFVITLFDDEEIIVECPRVKCA